MEYFLAVRKKNDIMKVAEKWMELGKSHFK